MKKIIKVVFVLIIISFVLFMVSTDYYIVQPGSCESLSELVTVEGGRRESEGEFYLTTINQTPANVLIWLYGYFNPYVELVEREEVIPPEKELEEYKDLMQDYMEDSKQVSKVVALEKAGYDIEVESQGVEVVEVVESSPAYGVLQENDLVVQVDGEDVVIAEDMVDIVSDKQIGEKVTVTYERNNRKYQEQIKTVEGSGENEVEAALQVYVKTKDWSPVFPMEVEIDAGDIGGPSAGLMFALEIMNQLTDDDLTGGDKIAGTGTINLKGKVGSVGGVRHKMVSARGEEVRYFFVPRQNAGMAEYVEGYYDDFEAIVVDDFDDAVEFLYEISD